MDAIQFDPGPVPLAGLKTTAAVYRYDGEGGFELLPHVQCLSIENREGPHPGSAQFRYVFDPNFDDGPTRFEEVFPIVATSHAIVWPDDRLVVAATDANGILYYLFDGFACSPQAMLSSQEETVTFQAMGVAQREWDNPLNGSWCQPANDPDVAPIKTGIAARFNPDGKPNAATLDSEANGPGSYQAPSFLDPVWINFQQKHSKDGVWDNGGTILGRTWTLEMAARYILNAGKSKGGIGLPPWQSVRDLLVSLEPKNGGAVDPDDPSTYDTEPIFVRDYIADGRPWPIALHDLISPHGFGMRFELQADASGLPSTRLVLWRKGAGRSRQTSIYLQLAGENLDPGSTNVGALNAQRDSTAIANVVRIESALDRWEASFILTPAFNVGVDDVSNKADYIRTGANFALHSEQYRVWVFNETGDLTGDVKTGDLSPILGDPSEDDTAWVQRRRPGRATLLSRGADNRPLKAQLAVSFDYGGSSPEVWDGSGTWRTIKGEWSLLSDQLGIKINCLDPNAFNIGNPGSEGGKKGSSQMRLVDYMAGNSTPFWFRLTTAIEGDQRLDATAEKRAGSPTQYEIVKVIDATDRYRFEGIHESSEFNTTGKIKVSRDDTGDALAEAYARQRHTEAPPLSGPVTIPRISTAYRIGDRIVSIEGRNVSMRTNIGSGTGEAPVYPEVGAITWQLDGNQSTTLRLDDSRGSGFQA